MNAENIFTIVNAIVTIIETVVDVVDEFED